MTNLNERDHSIDILKFVAVLMIVNSHIGELYPEGLKSLSTGGAIGDVLFFFCSGYTLFLGSFTDFFNWYKRRINRIYPTVFAWALLGCLFFNNHPDFLQVLLHGGGWFVSCIMLYYIYFWIIRYFTER